MSTDRLPRRRPALAVLIMTLAVLVGAIACTASDAGGASDGPTEIGSPATATAPTTSPAGTSAATTAPAASSTAPAGPTGVADAATAATKLYDAWVAGDRQAAATIAEPTAVDAIFSATPGLYELYRGCDTGEFDTGGCLFRDRSTNNTIQIDVERRDTGWVVSGAFFSPG